MKLEHIKKALSHLKKDKLLEKIISKSPKPNFKKGKGYFEALIQSIIYQQISGKAAATIEQRFKSLFKDKKPTPEKVLKLKDSRFKSAGISPQKMKYIKDLSLKFSDGTIKHSDFEQMSDEDIRMHLISVKGIGHWTIDMFLMFTLNRLDVLPTGDLGIQKGFANIFNLKKLPDAKKMEKLGNLWRPYRTIASWYLWRIADKEKGEFNW